MSNVEERLSKLEEATRKEGPSQELKNIWEFQNQLYLDLGKVEQIEIDAWQTYFNTHLNSQYFDIQHIIDIGLDFEVAFVLSKRGTGKTWSYMRELERIVAKGEQFVIVRSTKQDLEGGVAEQFLESSSPFEIKKNKVYLKGLTEDDDGNDCPVGYLAYLSGESQRWQGASYPKVTTIIWDECTNGGDTTQKTKRWIRNFWQLTSTFFRNKTKYRVWMFGNLMKDSDENISDALHKQLGIDIDCNLKYINVNKGCKHRLLYVNTGSLYRGADDHLMSNIGIRQDIRKDLQTNAPAKIGKCIVSEHFFISAPNKEFGIFTRFDAKNYMILVASQPTEDDKDYYYIIRAEELNKTLIGEEMYIVTDDANFGNLYSDVVTFKKDIDSYWHKLWKIVKSGNCVYVGEESYKNCLRLMSNKQDTVKCYRERFSKKKSKK